MINDSKVIIIVIKADTQMFLEWDNNSWKFQNNATNDVKQISLSHVINRRTPMLRCKFSKSHFGMGVIL